MKKVDRNLNEAPTSTSQSREGSKKMATGKLLPKDSPAGVTQSKLQDSIYNSERIVAQRKLQDNIKKSNRLETQRQQIQENFGQPVQKKENKTGLPDHLKSGIENLSGISMDDVRVHYNSSKPSQLQAHAYAQGSNIHLGSGQEKHLAHEAWHVVQQKQGRVKPTKQLGSNAINDDKHLEKEADVMGSKAIQGKFEDKALMVLPINSEIKQLMASEQKTDFGVFRADPYEPIPQGQPESGAMIKLMFTPNDKVYGRIGLVQTVKRDVWEKDKKSEKATKESDFGYGTGRVIEGEHTGWRVDQLPFGKTKGFLGIGGGKKFLRTTSPVAYGFINYHSASGMLPDKLENTPDPKQTLKSYSHNHNISQTGKRTETEETPAILQDIPSHPIEGGSEFLAETTAIILDGPMQKTYLGSIEWGYKAEPEQQAILDPSSIKLISRGVPSPRFMEAAIAWNRVGKIKDPYSGTEHLIIPLPIQYPGLEEVKDLPSLVEELKTFLQTPQDERNATFKEKAKKLWSITETEGMHADHQINFNIPKNIKIIEGELKKPLGFLEMVAKRPVGEIQKMLNKKLTDLTEELALTKKNFEELSSLAEELMKIVEEH